MNKYSPEYLVHRHTKPMSLYEVKRHIHKGTIVEIKIDKCDADNTLIANIGRNIIAKIPIDEVEYHWDNTEVKEAAITSKVNKHIKVVLKSFEKIDGIYIVHASRKDVQKDCFENFIKKLRVGDVIDAYVIKVYKYGVFCDIGCGIPALLPTNNISITHIVNPLKALNNITTLKVIVNKIDADYKIELSHKELLGTWEQEISKFNENDIVQGTVLSVEKYGVFVRISQNLSGLADSTNIELHPGDIVSTKIMKIKPENMKVKLSIIEKTASDSEHLKFQYRDLSYHIDEWVYSTPESSKLIQSKFY